MSVDGHHNRRPRKDDIRHLNQSPSASAVHDAVMRLIQDRLGPLTQASLARFRRIADLVKNNIILVISGVLTTTGIGMFLPSLTVLVVNLIGFTSAGVVQGSLAAFIQSVVYGGFTGGLFSALQSFGAVAAVSAPPVLIAAGLILGSGLLGIGGYYLYKYLRERIEGNAAGCDNKKQL